ncbi:MAG: NTP transferase domain-containing protein [Lachnospiraceae bacterium]|nr:NTP transferase domain-containing protein [Lachnospiraceae bacterium]
MKKTALIMAGGRGERFWPRSRKDLPKQFLSLTDDGRTMIQLTVDRILPLVDIKDVYVATNRDYKELVREQLKGIPDENILCEPMGRNTAPCIGLGAMHILNKYDDALMMVLPSDSLIKDGDRYRELIKEAFDIASDGENLVTMGIRPSYPETGYGYIKYLQEGSRGRTFRVDKFVEKPSLELAKEYLATGQYLWNAGMFVWKVSTIVKQFENFLPDMLKGLGTIKDAIGTKDEDKVLKEVFPTLESISIDYGIMEKAGSIYTIPGDFGWDDVGSWLAVERIKKADDDNNVIDGNVITIGSKDCIIQAKDKLIAAVGLKDIVVVDTDDATLICDKAATADIKKVLENLRNNNRTEYL